MKLYSSIKIKSLAGADLAPMSSPPVKSELAETAKCFIHVVRGWRSLFHVIFLSICHIVSVCRAFGYASSFAGFGRVVAFLSDQPMCLTRERGLFHY